MAAVKTVLVFMLVGAWLGGLLGTSASTQWSVWYNTPGAAGALCDCAKTTREIGHQVMTGHLAGTAGGTLAFMVLGIVFLRWRKARAMAVVPAAAPPSASPPAPPAAPAA